MVNGVISILIKGERHELDTYSKYSYDVLRRYSSNYLLCWHIANLVELMMFQYCPAIHKSIKIKHEENVCQKSGIKH